MDQLGFTCQFVLVPACSLIGIAGSVIIVRVATHKSMLPHLINRCILLLALLDLTFLTLALVNCLVSTATWPNAESTGLVAKATRYLAMPALARASLLVVTVVSAERLCAVRRPRHLQAGNSRRRLVYAGLATAAVPALLLHGAEFVQLVLLTGISTSGNGTTTPTTLYRHERRRAILAFAAADAALRGLPLAAILLLNACTFRVLRRSFRQREQLLAGLLGIQRALLRPTACPPVVKRHRRTTCMLLYMSSLHLLLLTPAIFLSVAARLCCDRQHRQSLRALVVTLEVLACCLNFPLYARQSEKFRAVLAEVWPCWVGGGGVAGSLELSRQRSALCPNPPAMDRLRNNHQQNQQNQQQQQLQHQRLLRQHCDLHRQHPTSVDLETTPSDSAMTMTLTH